MTDESTLADLRAVADYQFGSGAGVALFPRDESPEIRRSTSGRPRQVVSGAGRVASFTTEGRFSLGIEGGRRLHGAIDGYRVEVGDESEPYVREGRNAFAKFVRAVDPAVRPGDDVLVVHSGGALLGVGRAELSATAMRDFDRGMAVSVREGAGEAK